MLDMLRGLEAELIRAPRDLDLEGRVRIIMRDSLRSTSRGDSPADIHPRLWPDWPIRAGRSAPSAGQLQNRDIFNADNRDIFGAD